MERVIDCLWKGPDAGKSTPYIVVSFSESFPVKAEITGWTIFRAPAKHFPGELAKNYRVFNHKIPNSPYLHQETSGYNSKEGAIGIIFDT